MDPDQTAPGGAVRSGSTLFAKMTFKITSRLQKQTTIVVIGSLRVNMALDKALFFIGKVLIIFLLLHKTFVVGTH